MKTVVILTFVFSVSLCLGNPSGRSLLARQRRDVDYYSNTKVLIQDLVTNLKSSVLQAGDAVSNFSTGLTAMGVQYREQLANNVGKYKKSVTDAINSATDRFTGAGIGVRECVDNHRKDAENLFTGIMSKAKTCADDRIKEIKQMIDQLRESSSNATDYASSALVEMQACTQSAGGFITTGTCLAGLAIRTEIKGAVYIVQSGILIARINLSLSTLPSALEVCAATRIIEAGIASAKIVMEISGCSASSAYSSLMGNNVTNSE